MDKINGIGPGDAGNNTLSEASKFITNSLFPNGTVGTSEKGVNCLPFTCNIVVDMIDRWSGKNSCATIV